MVSGDDQETSKEFSLLTSLRQHFATLRQQDTGVSVPQLQVNTDDSCTSCWTQSCTSHPQAQLLLHHKSHKPFANGSHAATSAPRQRVTVQLAEHTHRSPRSPVFLVRDNKHHQKKQLRQHAATQLVAEDSPNSQHPQLGAACRSAETASLEAAPTAPLLHALQLPLVQKRCKPSVGDSSSVLTPYQQASVQDLHGASTGTAVPQAHTTHTTPHISNVSCIRAQPRLTWEDNIKPTDSVQVTNDICLGHIQGRQSTHTFQVAPDLSKAGRLRTQNLHAAVKASMHLMHRFVVRRSRIAHMGVFTTGYLAAGEMVMEYAGEVIRRSVADKREQQYTQQGLGLYFFALDRDYHIDATYKGNIARYINHSCWYDYKVSETELLHGTSPRTLRCNCNSILCRGKL